MPLLALLLVAAAAIWPSWPPLLETWRAMPEYAYGAVLVPFLLGWIAIRSTELPHPTARVSPYAAVALTASLIAWLVAFAASSAIGEQLMIPIVLWSAIWMAFGRAIAVRLAVPLVCLYFAIPVWEFLVPLLQGAAVWVVETVLGSIGVPVHIDGSLVSIPEGTFQIAEDCAGRRYFIVCVTVAAVFAGVVRLRALRAVVFIAIAAALAIVTNWVRVLTVIYAGHVTNMTSYLVAREHLTFGWALFALLMLGVGVLGNRFARTGQLPPWRATGGAPLLREMVLRPCLPATLLVLLLPVIAVSYARREDGSFSSTAPGAMTVGFPPSAGLWTLGASSDAAWQPRYPGAAAVRRGSYVGPLGTVEVFVAEYTREQRGAKLVSSANALYPSDWMVLHRGEFADGPQKPLGARVRAVWTETAAGEHWLVSYLYRVNHFATGNVIAAQFVYGVLAWNEPIRSRIAAVATRCRPSCTEARARLEGFWGDAGERLLNDGD